MESVSSYASRALRRLGEALPGQHPSITPGSHVFGIAHAILPRVGGARVSRRHQAAPAASTRGRPVRRVVSLWRSRRPRGEAPAWRLAGSRETALLLRGRGEAAVHGVADRALQRSLAHAAYTAATAPSGPNRPPGKRSRADQRHHRTRQDGSTARRQSTRPRALSARAFPRARRSMIWRAAQPRSRGRGSSRRRGARSAR